IHPAVLATGRKAARGRDVAAMIDADAAFHNAIYAASGNPLLEPSARLHWCRLRRAMGAVLQSSSLRATVWDEHQAIVQAIADGRTDMAESLTRQHARQAGENIARQLDSALSRHSSSETPHATHA
ncbi:MAG: GntR family transcriptional regulator, partial [Chitinophagaceae bacterium]|nr:GntR family transcriptional regulator [Rubrivivax sp.]